MLNLYVRIVTALHREDGATAVEYALMVALIAVVIIAAVTYLGQATSSQYQHAGSVINP